MTDIIQNPPQDAKQVEKYTNDVIEDNTDSNTDISFLDKINETEDKDELFELINSQYDLIKQHIQNGEPFTEEIEQLRTALYKYEDRCDKPEHIQTLAEIMETYNLTHEVDNMSHNEDKFIKKIHSFFKEFLKEIKDKPEQKETYNKSRKKLDIMLNIYKNRYGEDRLNENFGEILKIREKWDKLIAKQEEKKKRQTLTEPKVLSHMAQKTMNAIENKQKLSENNWGEMTECAIKAAEAVGVTALVASNPLLGFIFVIIYILDASGVEPIYTVCEKYRKTVDEEIIPYAKKLQEKYVESKNKQFYGVLKYLENYTKPIEFPKKEKQSEEQLKVTDGEETLQNEAPKPAPTGEQKIENDTLGQESDNKKQNPNTQNPNNPTEETQKPTGPSTDPLPFPFADNENTKPVIIQPQNQPKQENPKEQQESEPEPTTHLEKEQQRRALGNNLGLGGDISVY